MSSGGPLTIGRTPKNERILKTHEVEDVADSFARARIAIARVGVAGRESVASRGREGD